ncbi:Ankyrin repeat-containing protein BDA1 [Bienertia sinuspersici]
MTEGVIELLLEKNQELVDAVDDNGGNMLHQWIIHRFRKFPVNTLSKFQDVRTKVFRDLIHSKNKNGRNPFHIGASATKDSSDSNKLLKGLIEGYVDYQKETNGGVLPMSPDIIHPWKAKDNSGNTPVHEAIRCHNEEIAVHLLTLDSSLWLIQDSQGLTPLYLAAATGCTGVLDHYLHHQPSAVLFRNDDDTVLHWLNGFSEKQYEKYLKKKCFAELKNITDSEGATPLHLALRRKDILLAKVLLSDNEVQRSIKDNSDTTAMDLLAKLCDDNEDWV